MLALFSVTSGGKIKNTNITEAGSENHSKKKLFFTRFPIQILFNR